jgi:hypothetical protein
VLVTVEGNFFVFAGAGDVIVGVDFSVGFGAGLTIGFGADLTIGFGSVLTVGTTVSTDLTVVLVLVVVIDTGLAAGIVSLTAGAVTGLASCLIGTLTSVAIGFSETVVFCIGAVAGAVTIVGLAIADSVFSTAVGITEFVGSCAIDEYTPNINSDIAVTEYLTIFVHVHFNFIITP